MLTFQTVVGDNRKVAGVMMDVREIASPREMKANASLIVASPKLLEACNVLSLVFIKAPVSRSVDEANGQTYLR